MANKHSKQAMFAGFAGDVRTLGVRVLCGTGIHVWVHLQSIGILSLNRV